MNHKMYQIEGMKAKTFKVLLNNEADRTLSHPTP